MGRCIEEVKGGGRVGQRTKKLKREPRRRGKTYLRNSLYCSPKEGPESPVVVKFAFLMPQVVCRLQSKQQN